MFSIFIGSNILFEEGLLKINISDVVRLERRRHYQKEIESKN
jgi:hypothetical protein